MRLYDTLTRAKRSSCRRRRRPDRHVLLRPDGLRSAPRRQRAAVRRLDVAAALAARARLRRDARPQHHRHQRQDLRGGARRRARGSPPTQRAGTSRTPTLLGLGMPGSRAAGDGDVPEIVALHRGAGRARPRVRGRRRRLLPRRALPGLRATLGPPRRRVGDAQPLRGGGAERAQGGSARLRALEGAQGGRGHVVGLAVGPRPPRLAHRVLGDGREALGPAFEIHGGGLDLVFPHHENEIAQSRGARAASSRGSGCTTGCSGSAARRCRSRSGTSSRCATRSRTGGARRSSCSSSGAHWRSRSTSPTRRCRGARRGRRGSATSFATRPSRRRGRVGRLAEALDDDFNTPEALAVHARVARPRPAAPRARALRARVARRAGRGAGRVVALARQRARGPRGRRLRRGRPAARGDRGSRLGGAGRRRRPGYQLVPKR